MNSAFRWLFCATRALGLALAAWAGLGGAWAHELNPALREQVSMIAKNSGLFSLALETTIYRPPGDGPFPVVVVPMRQGFSKSAGSAIVGGCNIESNVYVQAEDVKAVLDDVVTRPCADKSRNLVTGQSHGGWTTRAFGTLDYPGVRDLVNFAGGMRQEGCAGWESSLAPAGSACGRATRVPSIWFYGDNDSYFAPRTFRPLHENYVAAGGKAELVAFGKFSGDAHSMFGSRAGEAIWQPRVEAFMRSVDLPTAVKFPALVPVRTGLLPVRTDFTDLAGV